MAWTDRLRKTLNGADDAGARLQFVACYTGDPATIPATLFKDLDGLLAVQDLRTADGSTVYITYWRSHDHFVRGNLPLTIALGKPLPLAHGVAGPLHTPPSNRLVRWGKTWAPLLLTVGGLLGVMEVLSNRYDRIVAAPQFSVRMEKRQYDLSQGDQFAAQVTVENLMPVAELSELQVTPTLTGGGKAITLTMRDPQKSSLSPTKQRTFLVIAENPPSGEYRLKTSVTGAAGWLRDPKSASDEATVTIWPRTPRGVVAFKRMAGPLLADYGFTVTVGTIAPYGVECDITFPNGDLKYESSYWRPDDSSAKAKPRREPGPLGVTGLHMVWLNARPQTKLTGEFSLGADGNVDWQKLVGEAQFTCSTLKEKRNA